MKFDMIWIGPGTPQLFLHKSEAQGQHYIAKKVNCGLSGCLWARIHGDQILMHNNLWATFHDAHLNCFGHVIGLRDMTTADNAAIAYRNPELATAWRESLSAKINDELKRPCNTESFSLTSSITSDMLPTSKTP